ncbi:MAG TPA: MBL fold metallo-hydrolase [Prolixibacteraceae bacterium]|nr:MBL fold metallo-hydrolase [Prolixibacteraceae bacterium]
MNIEVFVFNPIQENTFVIYDESTGEFAIVDPGCFNNNEFEHLKGFISAYNLKPVKLLNTHCHFDHILGVERCRTEWNLKWEAHSGDAFLVEGAQAQAAMFGVNIPAVMPIDVELHDGDEIKVGNIILKAIHVPGHSPGSICFYSELGKKLISGDVLFRGSIGRTDLPQGDYDTLISGIKEKLLTLPDDVKVYPGHGPSTTIGFERANNPFLK